MYTDDALHVNVEAVGSSARFFEEHIYPTTRRYFGDAWRPGYDGDERISVLNTRRLGAAGAFSSADEEPPIANPYSNGRHMIYMNLDVMSPGTLVYNSVLAHEFQHAIHFFQDHDEDAWGNEGAAVLFFNEMLNGLDGRHLGLDAFRRFPHTQLTTWGDKPDLSAHYGAAFVFLAYFRQRYGDHALRLLIEEQADGGQGIDHVLARLGVDERFEDVFTDWVAALILDDERVADGRFSLADVDFRLPPAVRVSLPARQSTAIGQFTPYAVEIPPTKAGATFFFSGAIQTKLVPASPHSGVAYWSGNRGDMMNTTLTRSFDLTGLSTASLTFWVWYDLEEGWDYAYVSVSTDEGQRWTTLPTRYTTTENPVGNNLGHGYTGRSGHGTTSEWVADSADLTPYVGQRVLIRFEYVTDDAITEPGFCVDDIAIPELGFSDDAENSEGWDSRGFVHSTNLIPQTFAIRFITFAQSISVQAVAVDDHRRARIPLPPGQQAIVVIAATAPVTTESAQIEYTIHNF